MQEACTILLVEDDQNDAFLLQRALKEMGFKGELLHFTETTDAKQRLESAAHAGEPLPAIIIADSAISYRDSGVQLLEWVRNHKALEKTPFVILSGGVTESTRRRAEQANVTCIVEKTADRSVLVARLKLAFKDLPDSLS